MYSWNEGSSNTNISSNNNNYNHNNSDSKLNNNSRIFSRIVDDNDKLYNGSDSSNMDIDLGTNSIKSMNNYTTETQNFSKLNIPVTTANTITPNTLYRNRTYGPYSSNNSSFSISNNSITVNQIAAVEPNLLQVLNTSNIININNLDDDIEMKESNYNNAANGIVKNNNDNNNIINLESNKITITTKELESLEKSNHALKKKTMELENEVWNLKTIETDLNNLLSQKKKKKKKNNNKINNNHNSLNSDREDNNNRGKNDNLGSDRMMEEVNSLIKLNNELQEKVTKLDFQNIQLTIALETDNNNIENTDLKSDVISLTPIELESLSAEIRRKFRKLEDENRNLKCVQKYYLNSKQTNSNKKLNNPIIHNNNTIIIDDDIESDSDESIEEKQKFTNTASQFDLIPLNQVNAQAVESDQFEFEDASNNNNNNNHNNNNNNETKSDLILQNIRKQYEETLSELALIIDVNDISTLQKKIQLKDKQIILLEQFVGQNKKLFDKTNTYLLNLISSTEQFIISQTKSVKADISSFNKEVEKVETALGITKWTYNKKGFKYSPTHLNFEFLNSENKWKTPWVNMRTRIKQYHSFCNQLINKLLQFNKANERLTEENEKMKQHIHKITKQNHSILVNAANADGEKIELQNKLDKLTNSLLAQKNR
jgi:hypothetical protein